MLTKLQINKFQNHYKINKSKIIQLILIINYKVKLNSNNLIYFFKIKNKIER
jgi:hypothetical protein